MSNKNKNETDAIRTQIARSSFLEHSNPLYLTSSFVFEGGLNGCQQFIDHIKMCSITSNLGDSRSIISHPASSTHSKLSVEERRQVGISDGLIRVSVGLEHISDIIEDIDQVLSSCHV